MANDKMTFTLGVKTTADLDGINKLKSALKELNNEVSDSDGSLSEERLGFNAKKINEASVAINALSKALNSSFDSALGGINFNKFQQSIKESGFSMQELQRRMAMLGSEGYTAFSKMTAEALKMNETVKYGNSLTEKLWNTFKSTVTYTAFNALINTISKNISNAVTYVQDLDSSLNDIRIVSGQSAEQMSEFAVQANEAAKALGSNTKSYAEAALIYYQQGLTGNQVTERTDVTTKMANVTGESAQEVSEDLTAIWNNFYDGSKSLEYYADVITALGAATASSTDEISEGLGKFAAIADTVGLSYEYATSALATVVAETRQSADTVGTAFKTLFARLQGLTLGETLDDGTDLNKYSQALAAVGISIKDQNGQLRSMDDILNDMGSKWQTLNKDQQVALAQTVAGTRQYTYLVSLMDKWEVFQTNLNTATSAQGELNKQNNIYLERTETHLKKLRTASEDLYSSLFDNKTMNTWIDNLTHGVEMIDTLVESLGGLNNILPMLIAGGLNSFSGELATGASNFIANKQNESIGRNQEYDKNQYLATFRDTIGTNTDLDYTLTNQQLEEQVQFAADIYKYRSLMSKEEVALFNEILQSNAELIKQTSEMEEQQSLFLKNDNNLFDKNKKDIFGENGLDSSQIDNMVSLLSEKFAEFEESITDLDTDGQVKAAKNWLKEWEKSFTEAGIKVEGIREEIAKIGKDEESQGITSLKEKINNTVTEARQLSSAMSDVSVKTKMASEQAASFNKNFDLRSKIKEVIEIASGISQLFIGFNMLKNVSNIWDDKDLSIGEKILQIFMALSFAIPSIVKGLNSMGKGFSLIGKAKNYLINLKKNYDNLNKAQEKVISLLEKEKELREKINAAQNKVENSKSNVGKALNELNKVKRNTLNAIGGEDKGNEIKDIAKQYYESADENEKKAILEKNKALEEYILTYEKYRKALEESKKSVEELEDAEKELQKIREDIETENNNISEIGKLGENIANSKIFKNLEGLGNGVDFVFKKISKGSIDVTKNGAKMVSGLTGGLKKIPLVGEVAAGAVESIGAKAAVAAVGLSTLAIAAVAVGAAFVAWKIYDNHLKTLAASAQNAADAAKEHREQVKAESDSLNQLKDDYDSLISQYKEGAISQEELKNQAYELCMQYGDESLAVKALTGDYKDLEEAINSAQEAKALELVQADETALETSRQAASMAMFSDSNSFTRDTRYGQQTLDLGSDFLTSVANAFEWDLVENTNSGIVSALEGLGSKYNIEDVFYDGAHLNIDALLELYARDREGLLNALEENNSSFSVKIMDYLTEYSDEVNAYAEAYALTVEDSLNYINASFDKYNDEGVIKTYREAIDELTQKYLEENPDMTEEEASQKAKTFLSQDSSYQDISKSTSIAESILGEEADTDKIDELAEEINGLNNAQKEFLASNIESYQKSGIELEDWIAQNEAAINSFYSSQNIVKLDVALEAATSKGVFEQDDIDKLFNSDTYTLQVELGKGSIDIDKDTFEQLSTDAQMLLVQTNKIRESINLEDAIKADAEEIDRLEDEIAQLQTSRDDNAGQQRVDEVMADEASYLYDRLASNTDIQWELDNGSFGSWQELVGTEEEFQNIIDDFLNKVQEEEAKLTEAEFAYVTEYLLAHNKNLDDYVVLLEDGTEKLTEEGVEYFKNHADAYDDLFESAASHQDEIIELQEQIRNLQSRVDSNTDSLADWANMLKQSKAIMAETNSDIDSLQSIYQTLSSAVSEYNENHRLTADTVQSLISLDSGYLASLNLEGDALSLNTDLIELKLEAEKQQLRLSAESQLISELQSIAQNQNAIATLEGAAAEIQYAESVGTATEAMKAGYPALVEHIKAMRELSNIDSGVYDTEAGQRAMQAYYNRLKLIDSMSLSSFDSNKGGSSTKKKDKEEKDFNDEFDRYWDINKALDKIADSMQRLDKIQSKLHGKELIRSLQHENELLAIQTEKYKELAAEQNKELSEINEKLGAVGFTFDDNGEMTNYIAQSKQMIADFNQATADYNAGKIDDDSYEKMSNEYEAIKKLVDRYDALIKERRDTQNNIDDNARKELENNLQAWEVDLELRLDTKEAERDWNDFIEKINTDFKSVYTDFTSLFRSDVFNANSLNSSIGIDINAVKQVEAEIDKMLAGGKSSMFESISEAQEKLKELRDTLKDDAETLFDLYQEGWENYLKAIDEVISKMDEIVKRYEQIDSHLSHEEKMIELIYGDKAYDKKAKLYETQQKSLESQMKSYKQQIQFYNEQLAKEDPSSEAAKKWREQIREAENALQQAEESYMETSINAYQNKVDAKFNPMLEQAQQDKEEWEKQQALNDLYKNDEERLNDLAILQAKWNKLVNNIKGLDTQKKIKNLMEAEMADLEDRNELTQYDIDLMEKKMAVAQAMADMEDAQNNKNTMKVTRGEDGNWSYQYVADDSQVEEKQLAYLQAIRDQYELTQSHIREVNEEMLDNQITAITEMKDLYYQGYYNMEETSIKAQELSAYYWGEDGLITEQLSIGQQGIRDFNISTLELVSETCESQLVEQTAWSEEIIKLNETIVDSNLNNWTTCEEASIAYFDAVDAGYITLDGKLTDAAVKAGVTLTSIFGNVQGFATNVKDTNIGIESDIETLLSNVVDNFDDMFNSVHTTFGLIEDANEISLTNMINLWNGDDDSSFKGQIEEAITECDGYIADFWNDIADGCAAAGEDFTDIISSLEDIQYEIDETDYMTQDAVDNAADALDEYREYLEEVRRAWEEAREAIEEATDALQYYLSLEGKDPGNHNYSGSSSGGASGGSTGIGSGVNSSGGRNIVGDDYKEKKSKDIVYHLLYGGMEYSKGINRYSLEQTITANQGKGPNGETWGNWKISELPSSQDYEEKHYYSRYNKASGKTDTNVFLAAKDAHDQYPYRYTITRMKTGGYTGEWNNGNEDGKLAVLHQKELVLNSDDTKNILNAVDMVRQLSSLSIEQMIANAIAGALKGLNDIGNVSNVSNTNSSNTNNNISIYADFPNANNVNEIKEALLSLPNLANQYISRQMK